MSEGCISKWMPRGLMTEKLRLKFLSMKSLYIAATCSSAAHCSSMGVSSVDSVLKWIVTPGMWEGEPRHGLNSRQHLIWVPLEMLSKNVRGRREHPKQGITHASQCGHCLNIQILLRKKVFYLQMGCGILRPLSRSCLQQSNWNQESALHCTFKRRLRAVYSGAT